jgi:hypothetical protein
MYIANNYYFNVSTFHSFEVLQRSICYINCVLPQCDAIVNFYKQTLRSIKGKYMGRAVGILAALLASHSSGFSLCGSLKQPDC